MDVILKTGILLVWMCAQNIFKQIISVFLCFRNSSEYSLYSLKIMEDNFNRTWTSNNQILDANEQTNQHLNKAKTTTTRITVLNVLTDCILRK